MQNKLASNLNKKGKKDRMTLKSKVHPNFN